jgi:hypothetical protein
VPARVEAALPTAHQVGLEIFNIVTSAGGWVSELLEGGGGWASRWVGSAGAGVASAGASCARVPIPVNPYLPTLSPVPPQLQCGLGPLAHMIDPAWCQHFYLQEWRPRRRSPPSSATPPSPAGGLEVGGAGPGQFC